MIAFDRIQSFAIGVDGMTAKRVFSTFFVCLDIDLQRCVWYNF